MIPPETAPDIFILGTVALATPGLTILALLRWRRSREAPLTQAPPRGTAAGLLLAEDDDEPVVLAVPDKVEAPDDDEDDSYSYAG